jgi:hypothetical protein
VIASLSGSGGGESQRAVETVKVIASENEKENGT